MDLRADLAALFGLKDVEYRANLSKEELFHEAIANDRGRIRPDGPDDEPKACATKLGIDGPLVYYSDPSCTGRPVQDTFAVAWPETKDKLWWKKDFQQFDPEKYEGLLRRVVEHLNAKNARLYVKDVYCGTDPEYAVPYRFVGEYATHAMFAHNMFPKGIEGVERRGAGKRWTMLNVPSFHCRPGDATGRAVEARGDRRHQEPHRARRRAAPTTAAIVKKTMFTVMNYLLPELQHMSMHCSANVGEAR